MSSCFVTTLDLTLSESLREGLLSQGFQLSKPPYTIFSGKKKGVSCTLYQSGKLMVQGKEKDDFIHFYLEPEILKDLQYSHKEHFIDKTSRVGVDEAGKGDFFGPLCIAGVYVEKDQFKSLLDLGIMDSKKISDKKNLQLAKTIQKCCLYKVIRLFPFKYNELYTKFKNLNHLLAWSHSSVIEDLVNRTQCKQVIIDQFAHESLVESYIQRKKLDIQLKQRFKGEEDIVVAAASILARSSFLQGIEQLENKIGHKLPKGAGTAVKNAAKNLLKKQGQDILPYVCKVHFKTYAELFQ